MDEAAANSGKIIKDLTHGNPQLMHNEPPLQ